jgi:biopolymer transport protein ExbB
MLQGKISPVLLSVLSLVSLSGAPIMSVAQAQAQAQTPPPAPTQTQAPASTFSMSAVMAKIKEQNAAEAKLSQQRQANFRKAMEEQETLAKETVAKRNAAEARSASLSQQYDDNYNRIGEMNLLLEQHQGNLGELFGVTRQISGDAAGVLNNSLINAELEVVEGQENRVDFLRRIASARELPSIVELERIWLEMLYEIKADAQTARFTAPVIQLDDSVKETEVVRIGSYTAVGDGKFLAYIPSQSTLAVMTRQPPQLATMAAARRLQNAPASGGYFQSVVDPARGVLVALIAERPDAFERIENGEAVNWVILGVGFLGLLAAAFQYIYLFIVKLAVGKQLKNLNRPTNNNPLGRMLHAANGDGIKDLSHDTPELTELRISESVLREIPKLERFQAFLRLAVAAGPLLGLIGTVIGMILTFQSITASGTSDPKLMAHGIGMAMIATVLGLGIAIPLLFVNAGLAALSRSVVHVLEEQSTSILANRLLASPPASSK